MIHLLSFWRLFAPTVSLITRVWNYILLACVQPLPPRKKIGTSLSSIFLSGGSDCTQALFYSLAGVVLNMSCKHYASQLSAISRRFPYKVSTSKLWRFRWQRECIQWKQSARRLDSALRRRVLARLCFPLLSIILRVFSYSSSFKLKLSTWKTSEKSSWFRVVWLVLLSTVLKI